MATFDDQQSRYQFGKTQWSLVLLAGQKKGDEASAARNQLLVRYYEAVYRYLHAKISDSNQADELFSRFAERVLEIHPFLPRANPKKGRFRDYLKAVLYRMVIDYYRGKKGQPSPLGPDVEAAQPAPEPADDDAAFQKVWAEELMNHAWKSLEQAEKETGKPYFSLMLYRAQNRCSSLDMSQLFSKRLGRALSADNVRKLLQRGQEMLGELLVDEVARSLRENEGDIVSAEQVEEELIDLKLLDTHRRKALERFRGAR